LKKSLFVILCLEGALLSFNLAATAALVPAIAKDFGFSPFFVGKIVWVYMLPYGLAALFYGPLVRVFDAKKVELTCIGLFSLANILAGLCRSINTFFLARFLMGLFGASVIPLALILIARHISPEKRGSYVGSFFSVTFGASLLGLALSGMINWRLIYLIPGGAGLVLGLLIYFFLSPLKGEGGDIKFNYLSLLKQRELINIFTYIFLVSLIYHGIQQWLGVYLSSRFGFGQLVISMLMTLTSLSGIFGEAAGGFLADALGRLKTLNAGLLMMIATAGLLLFRPPLFILAAIMLIWGLGWSFNHAGVSTLLTDIPSDFLNECASLNSSVRFISGGLGAILGGALMQKDFNRGFIFFGAGLISVLALTKKLLVFKAEGR
jgi:predicted MFS family arabinose efflux permease